MLIPRASAAPVLPPPSTTRPVLLFALAMLAVIWTGLGLSLWREYEGELVNARREQAMLAHAAGESLERRLELIEQTLALLPAEPRHTPRPQDGPASAADAAHPSAAEPASPSAGLPGLACCAIVAGIPPGPHPAAGTRLLLTAPYRKAGFWAITAWRPQAGATAVPLSAVIPVDTLTVSHASVDMGRRVLQIIDAGGRLVAALPTAGAQMGRPAGSSATLLPPLETMGSVIADDAQGESWIIGFRRLPAYGLAAVVSVRQADLLAPYHADALRRLGFVFALTLLLALAGYAAARARAREAAGRLHLSQSLENAGPGVVMIDRDGRLLVINRRACELLELPDELMRSEPTVREIIAWQIGRGEFGPLGQVSPEVVSAMRCGTFSRTEPVHERVRPNGQVLEVRTTLLADGSAVRTFTDVTERRRNDAALAATREAAEVAGRARTDVLAVMSHEIRTPMNGIIGVSSLLLDMPLGSTEQHYVRMILESGQGLLRMINDILDFSRLDAGRLDLEQQAFELRMVVQDACNLLAQEARAKGLELIIDVADDVPRHVLGDKLRLRQVLLNLLGNGIKFTTEGSVRLAVSRVRVEGDDVRLSFAVTDTGIGIPADAIGRLFREFTQVDNSISRRFGGSGLGLAISRRLVEYMGGTIGVESTMGVGSTFRFDVKLGVYRGEAPAARPALAATADMAPPGLRRVLVAEDNATNRLIIARMLEREGLEVVAVENGREAVDAVRGGGFDMVLMDMLMPEMDGLTATMLIRAMGGAASHVPIIGLTANFSRDDEANCLAAGMDRFETKPINRQRLLDAIGAVAAQRGRPVSA